MSAMYTIARLMTSDEKDLVRASQSRSIAKLGEAVLRSQIERARHLRKKYDDLLQRQRAEAQSQRVPRGSRAALGNKKTLLKVDAFHDALARLEQESARRAGQIIPLRYDPRGPAAGRYLSALSRRFPGEVPSAAGYEAWQRQLGGDFAPALMYAAAEVYIPGMPAHEHRGADWLTSGMITAVSGPLRQPES